MPTASLDPKLVLNSTPQLACTTAPDGTINFLNRRWFDFTGRPCTDIVENDLEAFWISCVHPDDRDAVYDQWATGVPIGEPFEGRYRILGRDGEYHWFFSNAIPMYDPSANGDGPRLLGWVCTSTNIQPQISAEVRFSRLIETSFVGVSISDAIGNITYMNPSLLSLLGYERSEVVGRMRWQDLTPPEFTAVDAEADRQLTATGVCLPYEKVNIARDGRRVPILVGATCIRDESGAKTENAAFILDLTNVKRAETALVQSEKLAAVGRLAASISHEINNPLEAITNLIYIARMHPELPSEVAENLSIAAAEVIRCSQITTQTLRFHRQSTRPAATTADQLFHSVTTLYQARLANSSITLNRGHITSTPFECFEGEIRQVLSNLVANSIDAMRHGGQICLRAHDATDHPTLRRGVRLILADTGHGMTPDTARRIFQPFFTTRELAGTGLGLWISKDIIDSHLGRLTVRSRLHQGTVFFIFLPLQK